MKNIPFLFLLLLSCAALAQDVPFKQLRYDENYTYLKKDTSANWYNKLKFLPLNKAKSTYISFGGEVRYQYFHFENPGWGSSPADKDGYILSRFLGNADFHAGKFFRAFAQLQSSLADGQSETPSPVDQNPLEVHQAFVDLSFPMPSHASFIVRLGRPEFLLVDLMNNLDTLAEDPNELLKNISRKFRAMDSKKLERFVQKYGNARAKKIFA